MPKFCSLFSSSSGNSTLIGSSSSYVLVDAGVSCKRLTESLVKRSVDPKEISAILITHEHSDHIKGVKLFCSKNKIPLYGTRGTLSYMEENGILSGDFPVHIMPEEGKEIGDIFVKSFKTPHDSRESCGYTFLFPDGQKAGICTDVGHITQEVRENLTGCSLVMLESNHDEGMLKNGAYPYYLKRRILSEVGHLSNENCAKEVSRLFERGSTRFFLGHLSEDNNFPDLAFQTTLSSLVLSGGKEGRDFLLSVNKKENDGGIVRF